MPMTSVNNQTATGYSGPDCRSIINRHIIDQETPPPPVISELKVLCFSAVLSLSSFFFHLFGHLKGLFSHLNAAKMFFKVTMNPPSAPELLGCVSSRLSWRSSGVRGGGKKGRKVSRLSITPLSEHYLCQTPTILGSDTEKASRTSGRHGKTQQDTVRGVTTSVGTAGADD